MNTEDLYMQAPCSNCPFRKIEKTRGWLGYLRAQEIAGAHSFLCHKHKKKQCAGHMIMNERSNGFYDLAVKIGKKLNLSSAGDVFPNKTEMAEHHD